MQGEYYFLDESGERQGDPRLFSYSGFLMSFHDHWFLITAGHVIKQLDQRYSDPRFEICYMRLIDSLGPGEHDQPIPFDYSSSLRYGEYQLSTGMDYGAIMLRDNYRDLLSANRMEPVSESNWMNQHHVEDMFGFCLLGVPDDETIHQHRIGDDGEGIVGSIASKVVGIRKLESHPEDAELYLEGGFVGEVVGLAEGKSVVGMSGGPIFGFAKRDNRTYCWVVALQSAWDPKRKIVYGCSVPRFGRIMSEAIGNAMAACTG
ncbi:MAG: hypothetical protein KDA52_24695 [Planctomycetaceae bacterium]|nr:hypothetical protein [Planctomycetaceae bacterium]